MSARVAWLACAVWCAACAGPSSGPPRAPDPGAAVRVSDVDGVMHAPLQVGAGTIAHVLLFVLADCPIANAYAPEIAAVRQAFAGAGVRFFLVHVQPDLSVEAARAHAREYGHVGPILIDREHALVRATGATITPEAAVLGRDGALLYRGRIDDLYRGIGKKRHAATQRDLRDALAAVVAGQPVPVPRTTAIGCYISDAAAGLLR